MVESNGTAFTEMALRLHAKHCWCLRGTPTQHKLDDLYGLLRFLKASPFEVSRWWIEVIRDAYEAEAGKLLNTLLKLRQACCHPQVGSSGLRSLQQSPMSMEEILMVLVGKTKIEGEEALGLGVG